MSRGFDRGKKIEGGRELWQEKKRNKGIGRGWTWEAKFAERNEKNEVTSEMAGENGITISSVLFVCREKNHSAHQ